MDNVIAGVLRVWKEHNKLNNEQQQITNKKGRRRGSFGLSPSLLFLPDLLKNTIEKQTNLPRR
tara:strand:+ start:347 stop:535 length:189 start_codon:yes stop_codon:yes gene_type:complete